jgi:small subunit ribosomal protein S2
MLEREIENLNARLGGIRQMSRLPNLLFVVDIENEATAVSEANKVGIPVIAMVDTNCDPSPIDFVIPSNDDAIRAIKLMSSKIADAALEGLNMRKETMDQSIEDFSEYAYEESGDGLQYASDEKLLGAATLAKIRGTRDEDGDMDDSGDE